MGWFLIITGLEVSSRMTTSLTYSLDTLKFLFLDHHVFALWSSAFGLALLLRLLQHKIRHPFLVPVFFMVVPGLFYLIVFLAGFDYDMLRANGWVFAMPEGDAPGWQFYSYFGTPPFALYKVALSLGLRLHHSASKLCNRSFHMSSFSST